MKMSEINKIVNMLPGYFSGRIIVEDGEAQGLRSNKTVEFKGKVCEVAYNRYVDGDRLCISLWLPSGEKMATATVNMPTKPLNQCELFIRDYSEGEGMTEALEKAGLIERTGVWVKTGFVEVEKCRLISA